MITGSDFSAIPCVRDCNGNPGMKHSGMRNWNEKPDPSGWKYLRHFCKRWKGSRPKLYDYLRSGCENIILTFS